MTQYALITGASGGIGRDLADCFAADGISLILVARSQDKLIKAQNDISQKYKIDVKIYPLDLTEADAAKTLHEWTKTQELTIRYLVNNAGFGDRADLIDAELGKLQKMISLNSEVLMTLSKLFGADMAQRQQGNIVNIASVAGLVPGPGMAVYYATKAFVLSFSQALNEELRTKNVIVTAVCPGSTTTGFADAANATKTRLFSGNLPTSRQVAAFSYRAMKTSKIVAVRGLRNRVASRFISLAPRRVVLSIVHRVQ